MNKEQVHQINDYKIVYDKGENGDRSCMIIGKQKDDEIWILANFYDETADIINDILNCMNKELCQGSSSIKNYKAINYIKSLHIYGKRCCKLLSNKILNDLLEILEGDNNDN